MAKEKLHVLCNFFFSHYVFKKLSAAEASESVYMRERVKKILISLNRVEDSVAKQCIQKSSYAEASVYGKDYLTLSHIQRFAADDFENI